MLEANRERVLKYNFLSFQFALSLCAGEELSYDGLPFYSPYLAKTLRFSPFEQYGLYGTLVGGGVYLAVQLRRAHYLMKYAELKDINPAQAELFGDMANVQSHYQLDKAARLPSGFGFRVCWWQQRPRCCGFPGVHKRNTSVS